MDGTLATRHTGHLTRAGGDDSRSSQPRGPLISDATDAAASLAKELSMLVDGVRSNADMLFGSQPASADSVGAPTPKPESRGDQLRGSLDAAHYWMHQLRHQLQRLEQL
jgi:hypothetical protein